MKFPALFKSSTLSGSLGLYVPAIALQKLLGLGRLLVFIHFMSGVPGQYNLWAAGIMVVDILSPLVCLGSNQGIARYVSVYQARGLLAAFYRRMRWGVLGLCIAMTLLAACGGDIIRRLAIDAPDARIDPAGQMLVVYAALACVLASALYMNLMGLLNGLRTYRLASAVELLLGVAFTLLGLASFFPKNLPLRGWLCCWRTWRRSCWRWAWASRPWSTASAGARTSVTTALMSRP